MNLEDLNRAVTTALEMQPHQEPVLVSYKLYGQMVAAMQAGAELPKFGFGCVAEVQLWLRDAQVLERSKP